MPKVEFEILEVRKYFKIWITEVSLSSDLNYFNIHRISEGISQRLLNLIFDYELEDLNVEKKNFPGIDLGDRKQGVAFQITSRKDTIKILQCLKVFSDNNYKNDFPKGIRFFIINTGKAPSIKPNLISKYQEIFDLKTNVYFPSDIIRIIEGVYFQDPEKFFAIKNLLNEEFGDKSKGKSIVRLENFNKKLEFYKKLFIANHDWTLKHFVPFDCKQGDHDISTEQLSETLLSGEGASIIGPSGCGKSVLAKRISLSFFKNGIPVLIEAKYYDGDLNALFEKEVISYGFSSGSEYFDLCKFYNLKTLLVIDGINECQSSTRPKLILEIEYVVEAYPITLIITSQKIEEGLEKLKLNFIKVSYPELATKRAIASSYSRRSSIEKLEPLLSVVSSSMEARMIGEIGSSEIDNVSRFTLFEIFIYSKLGQGNSDGFVFLAHIAKIMSERITFNISERVTSEILRKNNIPHEVYQVCLLGGLLDSKLGKVSFSHEMFFNFFVAESIVRFAKDVEEIITAMEAPKNSGKKLLIIGAIDETEPLEKVLWGLTDVDLFVSLYWGDGGTFCQLWVEKQIRVIIKKIAEEIGQLKFEFGNATMVGMQFQTESYWPWTNLDKTLIHTMPYLIVRDQYLQEVFDLIGLMDDVCSAAAKDFSTIAREKNISARNAVFYTAFLGAGVREASLTKIFSTLQSGFATFRNPASVTEDSIKQLLKDRSIKNGQFYFLLLLLRYDDKLRQLYPYVTKLLRNWKSYSYYLTQEVLQHVPFCYETEEQRIELVNLLNDIHSETQNIMLSTSIFEALSGLGALVEDALAHEESVSLQIKRVLDNPGVKESWDEASRLYYCQFDHPYDIAYQTVIERLSQPEKSLFICLALRGYISPIFTTSLIQDGWKLLQNEIAPYMLRWIETPMLDSHFPQDSIVIFFSAHLILAKSNYAFQSRFSDETDHKNKVIFATAEIFYWLNRTNLDEVEIKAESKKATDFLFSDTNPYVIESLWRMRENISQSGMFKLFEAGAVQTVETAFPNLVIAVCRFALQNIGFQKDILELSRGDEEIVLHAIWLLESSGTMIDVDVLRPLAEHSVYGDSAVKAIKVLGF